MEENSVENKPYVLRMIEPIVYNNISGDDQVIIHHKKNKIPTVRLVLDNGNDFDAEISYPEQDPLNYVIIKTNGNFIYKAYVY